MRVPFSQCVLVLELMLCEHEVTQKKDAAKRADKKCLIFIAISFNDLQGKGSKKKLNYHSRPIILCAKSKLFAFSITFQKTII